MNEARMSGARMSGARMSGTRLAQATHGRWHGEVPASICGVLTDTRNFHAGAAFLALRGERFNGHDFAAQVADRASALIGDTAGLKQWCDLAVSQLEVADTLQALGEIAHAWRMTLAQTTVVAISGSYGKTSLRSLLEAGFAALGVRVAATHANDNNLIGVPQTLLAIPSDAEVALVECGISERGEMARLAGMVQPDVALLTGITAAHGAGLGGLTGVIREKAALLTQLNDGGWVALGEGVAEQLQRIGMSVDDALAEDRVTWQLNGRALQLRSGSEVATLDLALPARHWAVNMAFAASIIRRIQRQRGAACALTDLAEAFAAWQPPAGRLRIIQAVSGATIFDDCYNANPVSMQAALDTLRACDGRRVAILGDMAELGDDAPALHAGLDVRGVDALILVGTEMRALAARHPDAAWYADSAALCHAGVTVGGGDCVLVKGSRSMVMESIVALLTDSRAAEVAHVL